ncbi:MAG: FkbM family methyltransferase [Proteobacteria bacterium]|nr:FkbM family methyltransferase [Pseudomonadota bacterium]MBU4384658.1 FkbM family methyltransferase [Pseudomonadota bacterium]MCG2766195.1 FkbM family methyltransferase [Desulfarculaceae bacterium]
MGPDKIDDLSNDWRIKTHHCLQKKIFMKLKSKGLRGVGYLERALKIFIKLPEVHGPVLVRIENNLLIRVDPLSDFGLEKNIFETGTYEAGTLNLIKKLLRPGDCFVDAGANIGLMSLVAARAVGPTGSVYSFEPEPAVHSTLKYNVELNGLAQIKTFNLALGSKREQKTIHKHVQHNRGGATLVSKENSFERIPVMVDTLDNIIAANSIEHVKLLKIDVEGWESEVLAGSTALLASKSAPIIILEYPQKKEPAKKIYNFLTNTGNYEIYSFVGNKNVISPLRKVSGEQTLPRGDNIVCMLSSQRQSLPGELFV